MAERGYRYFEGRWRLPQEIELILQRRQKKRETKQWVVCLRRWRKHLDLRDAGAAIEAIRSVRHPAAVPAITQLYASETAQSVKLLPLETLVTWTLVAQPLR